MVNIVENWADVSGEVVEMEAPDAVGFRAGSAPAGFVALRLRSVTVADVAGFANLIRRQPVETTQIGADPIEPGPERGDGPVGDDEPDLSVLVPAELAERIRVVVGSRVSARVRRSARGSLFVHPAHLELVPVQD